MESWLPLLGISLPHLIPSVETWLPSPFTSAPLSALPTTPPTWAPPSINVESALECSFVSRLAAFQTVTAKVSRGLLGPPPSSRTSSTSTSGSASASAATDDFKPLPSIVGDGAVITVGADGAATMRFLEESTSADTRLALSTLLNGSASVGLHFAVAGKDERYFVKNDFSAAEADLRAIGLIGNSETLDNGVKITVHRFVHGDVYGRERADYTDIRLSTNHTVANIRYGTTLFEERTRVLRDAQQRASERAWKYEQDSLLSGRLGSYDWNEQQRVQILRNGYLQDYVAEALRSVEKFPDMADDFRNIRLIKRNSS